MYRTRDLNPPRGMRDFTPDMEILRRRVFNRIEKIFQKYGFDPIETPIVERWEILSGKYGIEAESKLIWRFKLPYSDKEFGLRYDLTVPLARYIARYRPKMPFKRYHIGRVYRYEEPQKGRYREFWQCDIDIVGTDSPLADTEILNIVIDVFEEFNFRNYVIKLNDRRLLKGIFEDSLGIKDNRIMLNIFRIIDKLEKIGKDEVLKELRELGLREKTLKEVGEVLDTSEYDNEEILEFLGKYTGKTIVSKAVNTLNTIIEYISKKNVIKLDLSMVRGLDYYTGMIYEAVVKEPRIGSLSGGGRYDNLIGMFMGKDVPAVGGSIGVERLIDAGLELGLFKLDEKTLTSIGILYSVDIDFKEVLKIAETIRNIGINVYVPYSGFINILKGIKDFDKRGLKYALILGKREKALNKITLQNLETRERLEISRDRLRDKLLDILK